VGKTKESGKANKAVRTSKDHKKEKLEPQQKRNEAIDESPEKEEEEDGVKESNQKQIKQSSPSHVSKRRIVESSTKPSKVTSHQRRTSLPLKTKSRSKVKSHLRARSASVKAAPTKNSAQYRPKPQPLPQPMPEEEEELQVHKHSQRSKSHYYHQPTYFMPQYQPFQSYYQGYPYQSTQPIYYLQLVSHQEPKKVHHTPSKRSVHISSAKRSSGSHDTEKRSRVHVSSPSNLNTRSDNATLGSRETRELCKLYSKYDKDRDNLLTNKETQSLLRLLGMQPEKSGIAIQRWWDKQSLSFSDFEHFYKKVFVKKEVPLGDPKIHAQLARNASERLDRAGYRLIAKRIGAPIQEEA